MALPTFGQLSMNDINRELNRTTTAQISLDGAESGTYGSINTQSSNRPNNARPAAISEWYGYDHDAGPSRTRILAGYNQFSGQFACSFGTTRTVYGNGSSLQNSTRIYRNSSGILLASVGFYVDVRNNSIARYWNGNRFSASEFCRVGGGGGGIIR